MPEGECVSKEKQRIHECDQGLIPAATAPRFITNRGIFVFMHTAIDQFPVRSEANFFTGICLFILGGALSSGKIQMPPKVNAYPANVVENVPFL
jgi:hypothetical protein